MQTTDNEQRLITLAIHTYDRAVELKHTLEHAGIPVVLHNVNLTSPVVSSGVRVRIREIDLPAALRVVENSVESVSAGLGTNQVIIVPIDFADFSTRIIDFAFRYAAMQRADILLLHAYINPALSKGVQLSDNISFELGETQETDRRLYADAHQRLDALTTIISEKISNGALPSVKFSTRIMEGVPEDTILEVAKEINPLLIIMATRTSARKEEEMIGSVTAEVLDISRFPVLSVPECVYLDSPDEIQNVIFLANLDQADLVGIETVNRMFPHKAMSVRFISRPTKKDSEGRVSHQLETLVQYCSRHYPNSRFSYSIVPANAGEDDYRRMIDNAHINLIAIPNKKRNVFSRFFNPSVAHRLLLNADAPVMTLPV